MLGLRIYNLFPRLAGQIDKWYNFLRLIHDMEFNWIYVNPINYPGFSGSLYSIKDPFKLNPLFVPKDIDDSNSWNVLKEFIDKCHEYEVRFMVDLVINHLAIDSELLKEHPEWFKRKWILKNKDTQQIVRIFEGNVEPNDTLPPKEFIIEKAIANPYAIDPADARKITIWGDLAEIDFETNVDLQNLIQYWKKYIEFCLNLGIDGFRCDAAYKIPSDVWTSIINHAKSQNNNLIFFAETLGCTLKECEAITKAGFDYICSSSKWWDFTSPWCVEQYNQFRNYAPSISFPESHDTPRLAYETNNKIDVQIFRYLFAAFFSAGVLIPIGYEYGFKQKLDVVQTIPEDWEEINFDITPSIKGINHWKANYRCLNEDGEITHFYYHNLGVLLLRKTSLDKNQYMFLIYNKDWHNNNHVYLEDLRHYLNLDTDIMQIFLDKAPELILDVKYEKNMLPNEYILLFQEK